MSEVEREYERLAEQSAHLADHAQRTWVYLAQLSVALLGFGLAPLVPGAARIFGVLRPPLSLLLLAPGLACSALTTAAFKRGGSQSTASRWLQPLEATMLYGATLAVLFSTRVTWSVLWILSPFTTTFWANSKPFWGRTYITILIVMHGCLVAAYLLRGGHEAPGAAWLTAAIGVMGIVTFEVLARPRRLSTRVEAERNVLRARLDLARLDTERERIATMLRERVGVEIAALAEELEGGELQGQAHAALLELQSVGTVSSRAVAFHELGAGIRERCERLCIDALYIQHEMGPRAALVSGPAASALLRIAQELVRNAITHGAAQRVEIELTLETDDVVLVVRNDGAPLPHGTLEHATGGLANARSWLRELDGSIEATAAPRSALRATVPRVRGVA